MKRLLIAVLWITCSLFNWGLFIGGFTYRFPQYDHRAPAAVFAVLGPFATPGELVAILIIDGWHFRMKPLTKEQRWEAFQNRFPGLDRDYFEKQD